MKCIAGVVAFFCFAMSSSDAFAVKGRIIHCVWQVPEVRVDQQYARASGEAIKADPRSECTKEAKKAQFKRTEYITCLGKHTKRFHDGGVSSKDAAEESVKFCDARISVVSRTEPECSAEYKRHDEELRQAEKWCQTDAKCLDAGRRAGEWLVCARAVARTHERKCYAARVHDLEQESVDVRISEECVPRTVQPDALALYRKTQTGAQGGKPISKAGKP